MTWITRTAPALALALGLAAPGWAEAVDTAALDTDQKLEQLEQAVPELGSQALALKAALKSVEPASDPREEAILSALRELYEERLYEPLWLRSGEPTEQARALAARIAATAEDGLDPGDYPLPALPRRALDDGDAIAAVEIGFSRSLARFVSHLAGGRLEPRSISRHITHDPFQPDLGRALTALGRAADPAALVAGHAPPHPQYAALRAKLADLREDADAEARPLVPDGPNLRLDSRGPRVAILRERLGAPAGSDAEHFDAELAEAVRSFQRRNGLVADAIVGPLTIAALNADNREAQIATIIANMERWRWMPRDLGAFHVAVNTPEFRVRVVRDGEAVHETRVIVGQPRYPTPVFSDEIDHLVVNPYWHVPHSIFLRDMLPEIQEDPVAFFSRGYEALGRFEHGFELIDPMYVDWVRSNPRALRIRQPPGDRNALGRIKFMFPNQHSVYLHDTPQRGLFNRASRAFSNGCVRVQNPLEFAEALLAHEPDWNAARLQSRYGGYEEHINLSRKVPVHLTYFTARVDADGALLVFPDVYRFDAAIQERLGLDVEAGAVARHEPAGPREAGGATAFSP